MSPARCAMPSSRMRAPSLIIGNSSRSTMSFGANAWRSIPRLAAVVDDQLFHLGIWARRPRARFVEVEAAPGFLPEASHFAELSAIGAEKPSRLAHAPADVEPGEIADGEWPHGKAEIRHARHRSPAATRLRAAAARSRRARTDACGCRQSRGRRRRRPAPCRSCAPMPTALRAPARRFRAAHDFQKPHRRSPG